MMTRYRIFQKIYAINKRNEQFYNKLHLTSCWKSRKQKILRRIYLISMWLNATDRCYARPETCRWYMDDNFLKPAEFLGDPTPFKLTTLWT